MCLNYLSYLSNLLKIINYLKNKFLLLEPSPSNNSNRNHYTKSVYAKHENLDTSTVAVACMKNNDIQF